MSKKAELCHSFFAYPCHAQFPHVLNIAFIAVALAYLTSAANVWAQDDLDGAEKDQDTIEEIVVTGSRIKRRDYNTASPLTTIDRADIAFTGQATLEETLNQLPQVLPLPSRSANYTDSKAGIGAAEVDLRGLGPGRSLVLLNGRRVAPTGIGNSVDLNMIPQIMIDRVEIITGGTSAVYGSDAIAGVVNFVTKDDYSGFGIEAGLMMAEPGDAESYDLNLAYGHNFSNGRGNVSIIANILEREPLLAAEREFTSVYYLDDWEGNLVESGSSATPRAFLRLPYIDLGDGWTRMTFDPDGTPREFMDPDDRYNFAEVNYLQVPISRRALGVMAHYDLTDRLEGYVEASFVRNEPEQNMAPTPAQVGVGVNLDNPLLTPEARQLFADHYTCDVNLACFVLARRFVELGPRYKANERDYSRLLAGFRGELWDGWDIDAWATYTKEESIDFLRNDVSASRLQQGLLVDPLTSECYDPSGGCVPLDILGEGNLSPEGAAFIQFADYENITERTYKLASVFVTGSPLNTWAGPLDVAVGAEWRSEDTHFKADDALFSGDALGFHSTSPVEGTDTVREIYAEAVVPLASDRAWADYLALEIGGRYSDYEHAGGGWTYKAGGEWQPFDGLRIRAMHQRSMRAPNASELFEEQRLIHSQAVFGNPAQDPCSASAEPETYGNVEKCVLQGLPADQIGIFEATPWYPVEYLLGGNPNLESEVGETWTLGAVISPEFLRNWTFAVDYFALDVTDAIGAIDAGAICFDPSNTSNVFCDNIRRDASGNIAAVTELTENRGVLETDGIDTQILYAADLPDFLTIGDQAAHINARLIWTHMLSNKVQENPATDVLDCAGHFGWPCTFRDGTYPEDRVTTTVYYESGALDIHLTWRWIEGTESAVSLLSYISWVPNPAVPSVNDEQYVDLGMAYTFGDNVTVRLGVNNLFDNSPPQMADSASYNTDTGLYDVFGRSYYLTLSAQF